MRGRKKKTEGERKEREILKEKGRKEEDRRKVDGWKRWLNIRGRRAKMKRLRWEVRCGMMELEG